MNNYPTKYQIGGKVKIISGLFADRVGTITDYSPSSTVGMLEEELYRNIKTNNCGTYTVKIGCFKKVLTREYQLDILND